tara:strand:- start:5943 stop:7025 length:1083 start_codon:yes stop_codon:yes gene_type:complete
MEITVRDLGEADGKSVQEVESELLSKHEDSNKSEEDLSEEISVEPPKVEDRKLNEEEVLSFIEERYGKTIDSLDEFTREKEESEPLPEDVAAYFKYKKETGRGIEDFVNLNKDINEMNPDKLLKSYLMATEKGLDEEDIDEMMSDYSYDEELDDETDIRKTKLAKKKMIAKAKDHFESEKEKYRVPLESRGSSISEEDSRNLEAYKQSVQEANTNEEALDRRSEWYTEKLDETFNSEFKGFEFGIGDKKLVYSPGDATELRKVHSDPAHFTKKFLTEEGLLTNSVEYHKALSVAMNPDKYAEFFYEQGRAEALDADIRKAKNINMSPRQAPQTNVLSGGVQIRSVGNDSGRGLRIKSKKK